MKISLFDLIHYVQEHEHRAQADGRDQGEDEQRKRQPHAGKRPWQRQQARTKEPCRGWTDECVCWD